MAKGSKKDAVKTKQASAGRSKPAAGRKQSAAKPRPAGSGTTTGKASKYEQSGAPWWKQHLPG